MPPSGIREARAEGDATGPTRPAGRSALHGRRAGKTLASAHRELLRTLLPRLALDLSAPLDPATLFPGAPRDLWLEVGFGGGEHLLDAAARHRDIGLIGCEPFLNGMAHALAGLAGQACPDLADLPKTDLPKADLPKTDLLKADPSRAEPGNIRLHCGDAGAVIDALPAGCLGRVFVFYPDPWPKRRQRKRRFVSDEMLARLARIMRPGAELRFATDIDEHCGWVLARLMRSPDFCWRAGRAADWQRPWPDWVPTRYEGKALAQGRRPCYLTAVRR